MSTLKTVIKTAAMAMGIAFAPLALADLIIDATPDTSVAWNGKTLNSYTLSENDCSGAGGINSCSIILDDGGTQTSLTPLVSKYTSGSSAAWTWEVSTLYPSINGSEFSFWNAAGAAVGSPPAALTGSERLLGLRPGYG